MGNKLSIGQTRALVAANISVVHHHNDHPSPAEIPHLSSSSRELPPARNNSNTSLTDPLPDNSNTPTLPLHAPASLAVIQNLATEIRSLQCKSLNELAQKLHTHHMAIQTWKHTPEYNPSLPVDTLSHTPKEVYEIVWQYLERGDLQPISHVVDINALGKINQLLMAVPENVIKSHKTQAQNLARRLQSEPWTVALDRCTTTQALAAYVDFFEKKPGSVPMPELIKKHMLRILDLPQHTGHQINLADITKFNSHFKYLKRN